MEQKPTKIEFEKQYIYLIRQKNQAMKKNAIETHNRYVKQIEQLLESCKNESFFKESFHDLLKQEDPEILKTIVTYAVIYRLYPLETEKILKKIIKENKKKDPIVSMKAEYSLKRLIFGHAFR